MKRRRQVVLFFCVLLMVGMMVPYMGRAEEAGKAKGGAASEKGYDDWHFLFYIPGWDPALSGDSTAKGKRVPVHMDYWQALENLKFVDLLGAGHLEVQKGPWGFWVEGLYMKMTDKANFSKDIKLPIIVPIEISVTGQVKVTAAASFDEAAVFYDVYRSKSSVGNRAVLTVDAYAGARYVYFKTKADVTVTTPLGTIGTGFSKKRDWVDPMVGGRILWNLSDRWMAVFRTDVGGFGLSSKFTLDLDGFLVYRANSWLRFMGGYRALYEDHQEGSGSNKFKYNLWAHAPWLGVGVEF